MLDGGEQDILLLEAFNDGRWRDLARMSSEVFSRNPSRHAFDMRIHALRMLLRFDLIDEIYSRPAAVDPAVHSAVGVWNSLWKLDLCEFLRRADTHVARFGTDDAELTAKMAMVCKQLRLSAKDIIRLGGKALLAALPADPNRPLGRRPSADWVERARAALEAEDFKAAKAAFYANYPWGSTDPVLNQFATTIFHKMSGNDRDLENHLWMAAWQNGGGSNAALEDYVTKLHGLGRSAEVLSALAFRPCSPKMEFFRTLALCDLGLAETERPPDPVPPGDFYDELLMFRGLKPADLSTGGAGRRAAGARPRFGVCISGQLRGFRQGALEVLKMFRDQGEVDVFLSVWDNSGAFAFDRRHLQRNFSPEVMAYFNATHGEIHETVARILPKLARQVEPPDLRAMLRREFDTEWVRIEEESAFNARFPALFPKTSHALVNQYKMFFQIYNANELRLSASGRSDKYDYVVRLRPDLAISKLNFGEIYERISGADCIATLSHSQRGLNDVFAIGGSHAMNRYASCWPRMLAAGGHGYLPGAQRNKMGEWHMLRHVFAEGCRPVPLKEAGEFVAKSRRYTDSEIMDALQDAAAQGPLSAEQEALKRVLEIKHGKTSAPAWVDAPQAMEA
jgi:hypothetical protein